MDDTTSETETQQSFRSPPRRRRSTFFERRESIAPSASREVIDVNKYKVEVNKNELEDLERYFENLSAEKDQWKKEVTSRRYKYHDLKQQYKLAVKAPTRSRIAYSVLTQEDIDFLSNKPKLSTLIESQKRLHQAVKESSELFRRVNHLDDVILKCCEDKVNKVTEYILEHSVIEESH